MKLNIDIKELIHAVSNNDWFYISEYIPNKIYKYRTFEKAYNIENIENNKIKLTDPKKFNDPYDSALSYSISFDSKIDSVLFRAFLEENKNIVSDKTMPLINKLEKGATLNDIFLELATSNGIEKSEAVNMSRDLQGFLSDYLTKYVNSNFPSSSLRVCSFTTKNDNMLMWTHYADEHRGFCIEYDISDIRNSFEIRRRLYPIIYTNELFKPQKYNFKEEELWAQELVASLFKSQDWCYEDEWRFVEAGGIGSEFFDIQKPSAIYFGARYDENNEMNKINVQNLIHLSDKIGIKKYKMKLSNQEFKMIAEPFT